MGQAVLRIWTVAILAGLVGAMAASGIGLASGMFDNKTTVVPSVAVSTPTVSLASVPNAPVGWASVNDSIASSVVSITTDTASGPVSGSGLLYMDGSRQDYVITTSTLVAGGYTFDVTYLSGEHAGGKLIGSDPISGLAMIAVPNAPHAYPAFGSSSNLQVAASVLLVGGRGTTAAAVYPGLVSSEDRAVDVNNGTTMQNLIAITSQSLPPPAAGAPVVDSQGRVVGIALSIEPTNTTDQGLVFAVPMDLAKRVAQQMLEGASPAHPWLGVSDSVDLPTAVSEELGLSGGAQVGDVEPDSPASRAGMAPSDIITSINGSPVTSTGSLVELMGQCSPGGTATISYLHKGKPVKATIRVMSQPATT